MVMKPTEGYKIVRVGWAALGPGDLVVGLKPIAAGAAVGRASTVPIEDGSAEFGWNHPAGTASSEWLSTSEGEVFDRTSAEDLLDRL